MADGKVKIGIDAGEYEKRIQQIKTDSMALGREMIQDARSYTTSAKETLDYLEQQIKAIERRNKLEIEGRKASLTGSLESGLITPEKYRSETGRINIESKEEKLQTQILRDLLTTIKENARRELVENRIAVEKRIQDSKTVDALSPKGDPEELLKETIQKGELARVRSNEREEAYGAGLKRGISGVGQIAGSSNIYDAAMKAGQAGAGRFANMGGWAGVGGAAGVALFALGAKALGAAIPYEQALMRGYGQTGINQEGFGRGLSQYGYTMDQAINERFGLSQARGRADLTGKSTENSLLLQRALSLDSSTMMGLETSLRGDKDSTTSRRVVSEAIAAMTVSGVSKTKGDLSLLPEYMQVLISINQEQLNATGEVNATMNNKVAASIAKLDNSFKNPQVLGQMISGLKGGLGKADTPQMQALQYSVLSRIKNKEGKPLSMFEMEEAMADPFNAQYKDYLPEMMKSIEQMSGGRGSDPEMFRMNLLGWLKPKGIEPALIRKLQGAYSKGGLDKFMESNFKSDYDYEKMAGDQMGSVGSLSASTAKFTNTFQQTGKDIVDGMNELSEEIKKWTGLSNEEVKKQNEKVLKDIFEGKGSFPAANMQEQYEKNQEMIRVLSALDQKIQKLDIVLTKMSDRFN
jgi:hypothetical protein